MTSSIDYDAFSGFLGGVPVDRYAFTGREWDSDIGLQYSRARMYSPDSGRWMSEDPIGFAAGDANLMRYVGNGPTNGSDPSGMWRPIGWLYDQVSSVASDVGMIAQATWQDPGTIAYEAMSGLNTGDRALANATADTVVSIVTLGQGKIDPLFAPNADELADGTYALSYGFNRAGTEVLAGVGTGGLSTAGKVGKLVTVADTIQNGLAVGDGIHNIAENGLTLQNSLQVGGSALGIGGNLLGAARSAGKTAKTDPTCPAPENLPRGVAPSAGTAPRLGPRRISDALYDELRAETPTPAIRDAVNAGKVPPYPDPALPGLTVTKRLHADHIVSMDTITRMEGFDRLTRQQQLEVLNNRANFTGLSETANTSKGSKSFADWTRYKKGGIDVDPAFRQQMMQEEIRLQGVLQQQIDNFLK